MAKKGPNGHSEFEAQMLRVLVDIRTELRQLSARVDANQEQTNRRLDQLVENLGAHWRELDRRVTALELRAH